MKGLLTKEKYIMWHNCKWFLLIPLFYLAAMILSLFTGHGNLHYFPLGMVYLFMGIMPITTSNVEIQSRWHSYCMTMPYSRRQLVSGKYSTVLIIVVLTSVICAAIFGISVLLGGDADAESLIQLMFMGVGCGLMPAALFFPLHFKFYSTVNGVRMLFSGIVGGMVGGMNIVFMNIAESAGGALTRRLFIFMIVMMALFALSWLISIAVFRRKDV